MHNLLGFQAMFIKCFFSFILAHLYKFFIRFFNGGGRLSILYPVWYNGS